MLLLWVLSMAPDLVVPSLSAIEPPALRAARDFVDGDSSVEVRWPLESCQMIEPLSGELTLRCIRTRSRAAALRGRFEDRDWGPRWGLVDGTRFELGVGDDSAISVGHGAQIAVGVFTNPAYAAPPGEPFLEGARYSDKVAIVLRRFRGRFRVERVIFYQFNCNEDPC